MTYDEISKSVEKLKRAYGECDPFRLCEAMGIKICFVPLGSHQEAVKGFFVERNRIRTITVNSDLPPIIQRIIVAHELCHAINHRASGIRAFHEIGLFDHTVIMEKDANLFAAELLLDDQAVLDVLKQEASFLMLPPCSMCLRSCWISSSGY